MELNSYLIDVQEPWKKNISGVFVFFYVLTFIYLQLRMLLSTELLKQVNYLLLLSFISSPHDAD